MILIKTYWRFGRQLATGEWYFDKGSMASVMTVYYMTEAINFLNKNGF